MNYREYQRKQRQLNHWSLSLPGTQDLRFSKEGAEAATRMRQELEDELLFILPMGTGYAEGVGLPWADYIMTGALCSH